MGGGDETCVGSVGFIQICVYFNVSFYGFCVDNDEPQSTTKHADTARGL